MANYIINASPTVVDLGTNDLSMRQVPPAEVPIPQHLPKFYLFTQKGPTTPQLVVGAARELLYGGESFDLLGKYANHATLYANAVNAEGNTCMIQRVVPEDAGPESNTTLYIDVLETQVDLYERNVDGSIKLDSNGQPIVTGQANGYKVKWVSETYTTDQDLADNYGKATIKPGSMTDPTTGTQSQMYPIFAFKASSKGEFGNNTGVRLFPLTGDATPSDLVSTTRTFPFAVSMITRPDVKSSAKIVKTLFGSTKVPFVLKPGVLDPATTAEMYLGDKFLKNYQNINDPKYPLKYSDIGDLYIYQDNIDYLLGLFHAAEVPYIDVYTDFTADPDDKYMFNFLTGTNTNNVQYHTFRLVDDPDSIRFTDYTNIWLESGSDGTLDDKTFAKLVKNEVLRYLDPDDPLMDDAINVESIIYDSGFPLETKKALPSFIAQRKDTFVVLSTHTVGGRTLDNAEELSLAIALRTKLQMYPESDYFGTPVMRGMVIGQSGLIRNSLFKERVSLSYEVAVKSARYMGAGNGAWKAGKNFDMAPGSIIDTIYDIQQPFIPASVRNRFWDVGLVWAQPFDRRNFFFPALKTVYYDDTSVLNSYFTAMAICQLNKVAHKAWRNFTGTSSLTDTQLIERVNQFVIDHTKGRFDNRFIIEPETIITEMDELRGYSWTLAIKIYAPNMKTVMTTYVEAYRYNDYQG